MASPLDLFKLDGRVAVVTGASSGLGARFVRTLAGAGASVVAAARREERINDLAAAVNAELGIEKVIPHRCDVTDEAEVSRLIETAVARFGRLDVMVNNAGITRVGRADQEELSTWRAVVDTNLTAVFLGSREAARVMLRQGSGSIINVASVNGLVGSWKIPQASYCASKGGVVNLGRELASQWASRGVRVNTLCPGWFRTEMAEPMFDERGLAFIERTVPAKRPGREGELDGAILFLASDASAYVHGQALAVDGGFTAI